MAQYNLLGGVNPINPEYEQQQAMLGKGTNWAEYGLRKEALKEQKKANKMNTIISGINTAFKAFDAYQQSKEFELKKESQELINTERSLDIQTKRIDLDAKQTAATEDKEFLDGLMALTEAKKDNEIGAWLMSHPKAAQRNADATWGSINRLRTTLGDRAADQLLSYTLPEQAEKIRQFDVGQSNANYRSQLASNTSLQVARMGLEGRQLMANAKVQEAEWNAAGNALSGLGLSGIGGGGKGSPKGLVNPTQAQESDKLLDNVKAFKQTIYNNASLRALYQDMGIDPDKINVNDFLSDYDLGYKYEVRDVKGELTKLSQIFGTNNIQDILSNINNTGIPEQAIPQTTASGKQRENALTGSPIVDFMNIYPKSYTDNLINLLQSSSAKGVKYLTPQSIDTMTKDNSTGQSILLRKNANGQIVYATPITGEETKVIQDLQSSMISYTTQLEEGMNISDRISQALDPRNPVQSKMQSLLGLQKNVLQAQRQTYRDIPMTAEYTDAETGETKSVTIPGQFTRQSTYYKDSNQPIHGKNGEVVDYKQVKNPALRNALESTSFKTEKEAALKQIADVYSNDPEKGAEMLMTRGGIPSVKELRAEHLRRYLQSPITDEDFNRLNDEQKRLAYNRLKNILIKELQPYVQQSYMDTVTNSAREEQGKRLNSVEEGTRAIEDLLTILNESHKIAINSGEYEGGAKGDFKRLANRLGMNERSLPKYIDNSVDNILDGLNENALKQVAERFNASASQLNVNKIDTDYSVLPETRLRKALSGQIKDLLRRAVLKRRTLSKENKGIEKTFGDTTDGTLTRADKQKEIQLLQDVFYALSQWYR